MNRLWVLICAGILFTACIGQGVPENSVEPSSTPEPSPPEPLIYTELTDEEILSLLEQDPHPVLYFHSPLCGTCRGVKELLEQLHEVYGVSILYVDKETNEAIYDLYHVRYFPALLIANSSLVYLRFNQNDSPKNIYRMVKEGEIGGLHPIEYTIDAEQIHISTREMTPDTLYYLDYEDYRVCIFIAPSAKLFVILGSQWCQSKWLYLKRDSLWDGETHARWDRETLLRQGGECGELVHIPFEVTGTEIIISIEDLVESWTY
jgi:thiol-disulfide isomerase/thioredoxin